MAPRRVNRYAWVLTSGKSCPLCKVIAGYRPRTYARWVQTGLPGQRATYCGASCYCILMPVGTSDDGPTGTDLMEQGGTPIIEDYLPENIDKLTDREQAQAWRDAAKKLRADAAESPG